ncbi:MAG: Connector [Bacteriophage sp.]|nr:MAG: Connector [Bacteriophage sp.]
MMPYSYEMINLFNSSYSPSTIHTKNTQLFMFFKKYLLEKVMSEFKFKLHETWDKNYFLYSLFLRGYLTVVNTNKFGVICQHCGLRGYNIYYNPTHAIITNPLLTGILEPKIGTQCSIIKLQPDYSGISDIVNYYADNMAMTAEACEMNIMNSKLSFLFAVRGKSQAESMKKILDKVMKGELGVFYDEKLKMGNDNIPLDFFNNDLKKNFIAPELQDTLRRWEEMFCNEVGIPNARSDKKERMIVDEVNSNNIECLTKAELWLETLKEGINQTNAMFNLNLDVKLRHNEGGENSAGRTLFTGATSME